MQDLDARELIISRFAKQIASLQAEIKQLKHDRDYERSRAKAAAAELEQAKSEAALYRTEYTKAVTSRSWKITRPLRSAPKLLSKLRPR